MNKRHAYIIWERVMNRSQMNKIIFFVIHCSCAVPVLRLIFQKWWKHLLKTFDYIGFSGCNRKDIMEILECSIYGLLVASLSCSLFPCNSLDQYVIFALFYNLSSKWHLQCSTVKLINKCYRQIILITGQILKHRTCIFFPEIDKVTITSK